MPNWIRKLSIVIALVTLLLPSAAAAHTGYRMLALSDQTMITSISVTSAPVYRPCKNLGGKRVTPCHQDIGLVARTQIYETISEVGGFELFACIPVSGVLCGPASPPPRLS